MANERQASDGQTGALDGDRRACAQARRGKKGPPPVHLWNPPFCGDLDMRIAADGTWFYLKTPIGRPALVKLFASVLKREGDKYFLVTPVEKCGITVDDAPFLAVEMKVEGEGARAACCTSAPMSTTGSPAGRSTRCASSRSRRPAGSSPICMCGATCGRKVTRALFYDLVELGEERDVDGERMFGVASGGEFFAMAPADSLKDSPDGARRTARRGQGADARVLRRARKRGSPSTCRRR